MKRTVPLLLALLLTLTMPACAASEAVAAEKPAFSDVPASAWYAEAVHYVSERGLMDGTGGGKFSPDDTFTRAQLATVLYRIAGQPDVTGEDGFSDTKTGAWYADAVLWASRSGVVNGIGGGQYGTNKPTAQEQLVTMLWRMEGEPEAETVADSSAYAAKAVGWARTNGIAPMTADYTFAPKENATRAQIAAVLQGISAREGERCCERNKPHAQRAAGYGRMGEQRFRGCSSGAAARRPADGGNDAVRRV